MYFEGNSVSYTTPTSLRIAISAWLIPMVVVIYAYTGVLTSLLTTVKLEPTVDTFDHVVTNGRYKVTIEKHVVFEEEFLVISLNQFNTIKRVYFVIGKHFILASNIGN